MGALLTSGMKDLDEYAARLIKAREELLACQGSNRDPMSLNLDFNSIEAPNLNSRLFLLALNVGGPGCRGDSPILGGPPPPPPPGYNRFPGPSRTRPTQPPGAPGHFMGFGHGMGIPFNMNGHRYESVPRGPV